MINKPECAVKGMIQRGAMCSHVIVGAKLCGFKGNCQHQTPPAGTGQAMYERHRFKTDPTDYRPVAFPPPGPYWCSGHGAGYSIVIAYLPKGDLLQKWWPDAVEVETEEVQTIFFTDRFPCPEWWTPPAADTLRPTTLDGIKRLAKRIGRERGLQHSKALEVAASQAGYPSFDEARAALS